MRDAWGRTPLHLAADLGYVEVAELLIANGAHVNAKDEKGRTPLFETITFRYSYHIPLDNQGQIHTAELLIAKGAEVNAKDSDGCTPLHMAAECERMRLVELFLEKGASVDVKDKWGQTPLAISLRSFNTYIAALLRKHGAKE